MRNLPFSQQITDWAMLLSNPSQPVTLQSLDHERDIKVFSRLPRGAIRTPASMFRPNLAPEKQKCWSVKSMWYNLVGYSVKGEKREKKYL